MISFMIQVIKFQGLRTTTHDCFLIVSLDCFLHDTMVGGKQLLIGKLKSLSMIESEVKC